MLIHANPGLPRRPKKTTRLEEISEIYSVMRNSKAAHMCMRRALLYSELESRTCASRTLGHRRHAPTSQPSLSSGRPTVAADTVPCAACYSPVVLLMRKHISGNPQGSMGITSFKTRNELIRKAVPLGISTKGIARHQISCCKKPRFAAFRRCVRHRI